jgi:hypothetical protein
MSAFLDSLKSDLLDRRVTPLLALLAAALLGAVVYAVLAGSGSSSSPATGAPVPAAKTAGIAVSAVKTDTNSSVAETTSGAAEQTGGASRNPFAPTPGTKPASSNAAAGPTGSAAGGSTAGAESTSSGAGSSGSEAGSSTQSGGSGSEDEQPPASKPRKTYKVSVLFGTAAPGVPVLEAGLTSYEHLTRQQLLPSAKQPVIVFRGVVAGGKSATFTLVGEAIPHGDAVCRPSPTQCQAINLKAGDTEELEYVPLGASPITYELHLVKIERVRAKSARSASVASADALALEQSKAGLRLLRREGLVALPGMRYSRNGGVLVFVAAHHRLAKHAHASA